jgi:hypothetical protein
MSCFRGDRFDSSQHPALINALWSFFYDKSVESACCRDAGETAQFENHIAVAWRCERAWVVGGSSIRCHHHSCLYSSLSGVLEYLSCGLAHAAATLQLCTFRSCLG